MQAAKGQLIAQAIAERLHGHTVFGELLPQGKHIHAVLAGHILLGTVDSSGIHADSLFPGQLQLGLVIDHPLQH